MLKIHHLRRSQSERIVWLCEELQLPYELRAYDRDSTTIMSPPELKAMHPLGAAPLLEDGNVMLAESAAIVEYVITVHGGGRLRLDPDHRAYPDFVYWFHFANGNLQAQMSRLFTVCRLNLPAFHPVQADAQGRLDRVLAHLDRRLCNSKWLAGDEFTAADIMNVFSLTTMRMFQPVDLAPYAGILTYLQRIGARPAYRRAMEAGDPGFAPLLS